MVIFGGGNDVCEVLESDFGTFVCGPLETESKMGNVSCWSLESKICSTAHGSSCACNFAHWGSVRRARAGRGIVAVAVAVAT